jgi:hypothetical protein
MFIIAQASCDRFRWKKYFAASEARNDRSACWLLGPSPDFSQTSRKPIVASGEISAGNE